jgi:hypothetical protein
MLPGERLSPKYDELLELRGVAVRNKIPQKQNDGFWRRSKIADIQFLTEDRHQRERERSRGAIIPQDNETPLQYPLS